MASNTEINRHIIGSTGALIDPSSPEDLADCLIKAILNKNERLSTTKLAVKRMKIDYNWGNIVENLLEFIK